MMLKDLEPVEAERVAALLDESLDMTLEQLSAWQAELAEREPRLCPLVMQLMASMASASGLLAESDAPDSGRSGRLESGARLIAALSGDVAASMLGQHFGPYRVLRLLGQGGMGSVWLAERADGLFERQVALKLIHRHHIDGAMRERFARERSILAQLEHPLIARLLDAGVTADGQPYLALEYVEGETLTEHCDARRLPIEERLKLVMQALAAVQHAHRNLVLHRDLKPANILVTPDGQIRLLDFGIAKLMTDGHVHETELTQQAGRALTPEFASPEQIAGRPLSTASDVYSLGVVLYVLLCGQRPYRLQRDSRGALEEAILSAQAVRPSQQQLSEEIAHARSTTSRKLARALSRDLDTIVLKAIKKEPSERYPTADAFMQDLGRYLAGEPVHARPDGIAYRVTKFVLRNRFQVAASACVALLLLLAAGVSIWQGQHARALAEVAQRETQRARSVQIFVQNIFKANSDRQPDPIRARQTTARELLDVGAEQLTDSLKDSPQAQIEVLRTLADMYTQLGLNPEAARLRERRVALLKQSQAPDDLELADAILMFVDDIALTNDRARALPALQEAEQILDRIGDQTSERRGHLWSTSADMEQYFSLDLMRGYADRALQHFRAHPADWSGLYFAEQVSARAHQLTGDYALAEAENRRALDDATRNAPASTWSVQPLIQLAEAQSARLNMTESERNLREALALSSKINGDEYCVTLQARSKLGGLLHETGRRAEGMQLLDEARAIIDRQKAGATPDSTSVSHVVRGQSLLTEGRIAEAERDFAAEVAFRRAYFPASIALSRALLAHASALTALGRYTESGDELSEAVRLWEAGRGEAARPETSNAFRLERARLLLARGDAGAAEQQLRELTPPSEALPLRVEETQAQLALAQVRMLQHDWSGALALAQPALSHVQTSPLRAQFPQLEAEAALRVGQAQLHAGAMREAASSLRRALELRQVSDVAASPWLAEIKIALADCLLQLQQRRPALPLLDDLQRTHADRARLGVQLSGDLDAVLARATQH